jgi:hypothetical protein
MAERLFRWIWYGALAVAAIAVVGLAAELRDGDGAMLRQLTVILSPPETAPLLVAVPAGLSVRATALEVEARVPVAVALAGPMRFMIRIAGGLFVLWQLRRVFASGRSDRFAAEAPRRIRLAGAAVISTEALNIAISFGQELWVRSHVAAADGWRVSFDADRDVHLLLAGLVLLAVAEAYRSGVALREEAELTI